jgi:putative FmdB family regulatory protein
VPIYEYECTKCGHQTEALQKFSDPPLAECELCHGKLKKFISHSTFHLKGSGWYVTDYASKSGGNQGGNQGGNEGTSAQSDKDSTPQSKGSTETSKKQESTSKGSTEVSKKKASSDK